jgi:mannose-6-phosphate isomerase-like protein (cupin superfamily)
MQLLAVSLLAAGLVATAGQADLYSPEQLKTITNRLSQKRAQFSSETLQQYGSHYTMMAHREATGSSEIHEKETDIFFALSGDASIVTGGQLVNARTQAPGELRGTSIEGGVKAPFVQGSVIHIPAGVPHQLIVEPAKPFTYFVVKIKEH